MTMVLAKHARGNARNHRAPLLLGAFAPDVPLWLLSGGLALYLSISEGRPITSLHSFMFDELYFRHPLWIVSHNFLHAPLLLLSGLILTYQARASRGVRAWLFYFLLSCLLHTIIDVATHASDGPLLLFPLNWQWRFHSPVSYWEEAHFGRAFTIFEYALDALLLVYLLVSKWRNKSLKM
jgi:hypothetical protein